MKKLSFIPLLLLSVLFMGGTPDMSPVNNATWHNALGLEYMRQDDIVSAIAEYKIAIALNPRTSASAAFHNNLGIAYLQLRKPDWAAVCFQNAIDLNPSCFYYYENLVKAYSQAGRLNQKYAYYKKQSAANFENSFNWMMLGLIQTQKHEYKNAVNSFNNYILLEPELIVSRAVKDKLDELRKKPM
jgi:tetratricopeptide (TPR) repeat protein